MNPNKKMFILLLYYVTISSRSKSSCPFDITHNISLTNQFIFRYIIIKLTVFSIIHQPSYEYNFNNELF